MIRVLTPAPTLWHAGRLIEATSAIAVNIVHTDDGPMLAAYFEGDGVSERQWAKVVAEHDPTPEQVDPNTGLVTRADLLAALEAERKGGDPAAALERERP